MEYEGLEISVADGVYVPAEDSFLAARMVSGLMDAFGRTVSVADIGTGTGILGLVAARSANCGKVAFYDVNPVAVELARSNYERNRRRVAAQSEFVQSDLFGSMPRAEMFDLVIFNAPYLRNEKDGEEKEGNPWAGGTEGVELSERFLGEAVRHLGEEGRIVLVASSFSNRKRLNEKMGELDLAILKEDKIHFFFEDISSIMIGRA